MTFDELKLIELVLLDTGHETGWYMNLANALIIIKREIKLKELKF